MNIYFFKVFQTSEWVNPNCTLIDDEIIPGNTDYFGPNSVCNNRTEQVDTCRYRAYRNDPTNTPFDKYGLNIEWFRIMVARLVFVVVFEVSLRVLII